MNKGWLVIRFRHFPVSFRAALRVPAVLLMLLLVALAAMVVSVGQGEYPIPPLEVLKTLLGWETQNPDYPFIINTLHLPRTLVAFMVGVGLAISGTILPGITRNSLADPEIVGMNAAAGLASVALIVLVPSTPLFALPLSAFGGAMVISLLIYLLAWDEGSSPIRLILVGAGLAFIARALTLLMITFGDISSVSQALVWLAGSVYGRTWEQVLLLLPWLGVFVPLALVLARHLNALNLGDDLARGLGSSVEWQHSLLLLKSMALVSASVATAGTIAFVGPIAPHIGRQVVGANYEGLILVAAMLKGAIVVIADLLGRILFAPIELPCGVITAAVGAPYFLYLSICHRWR